MSVSIVKGDIFSSGAQAITNTVNCWSVMGKGIALEFKKRYPAMFTAYQAACSRGEVQIGKMWIWTLPDLFDAPQYIINFPTKLHWKNPSQLAWIEKGLDDLHQHAIMMEMTSIALPALGCSNGGLKFEDVRALVETKLDDLNILLYEPQ